MQGQSIKKPLPVVLVINICDQIIRDEITKKISLIGIFNVIGAASFPVRHPCLHVHIALTNGHGDYMGELRFLNLNNSQIVARMSGPIVFSNPIQVIEFNFEFRNLEFRNEGKYRVEFLCDNQPVGRREFVVVGPKTIPPPISQTGGT